MDQSTFPASEGPRSIITGNDETQRQKYTTAYEATDQYVKNLLDTNAQTNPTFHPIATQLTQLTHCLHQTRQETDNVLTMAMNKDFPTKRKQKEALPASTDMNDDVDGQSDDVKEQIKRQRALDTTEYFSGSEDEGDEVVQLGKDEDGDNAM